MRAAEVGYNGKLAGILSKSKGIYRFVYDKITWLHLEARRLALHYQSKRLLMKVSFCCRPSRICLVKVLIKPFGTGCWKRLFHFITENSHERDNRSIGYTWNTRGWV